MTNWYLKKMFANNYTFPTAMGNIEVPSLPEKFNSENPEVISFDYDDTMTEPNFDGEIWVAHNWVAGEIPKMREDVIQRIRDYANDGHRVIIVTARGKYDKNGKLSSSAKEIYDVVKLLNLPIDEDDIYFTEGGLKGEVLKELSVKRHYDDLREQINSANSSGVEGIRVWHPYDWRKEKSRSY